MTFFLRVDTNSDEIVGWQRTAADTAPPPPTGVDHIVIDDTLPEVQTYRNDPAHPDGGPPRWSWNGTNIVETTDPRTRVRVTQNPDPGLMGQSLTVTLEVIDDQDQVMTGVNRTDTVNYLDVNRQLRRAAVTVVAGVAARSFTPSQSGEMELVTDRDNIRFVGDNPVVIDEDW